MPKSRRPLRRDPRAHADSAAQPHELAHFEPLEPRILLSGDLPHITAIDADNRGLVVVEVSARLNASTVNANALKLFTAGADGLLGTADDRDANASVSYDPENNRITIDGQSAIDANERYAVSIDGDLIRDTQGRRLDAEFNGLDQNTGNGVQGGELLVYTTPRDQSLARFTTILGEIDVRMFDSQTPITVNNFFRYADLEFYDDTFFHRSVEDFVIQGGGFDATDPDFDQFTTFGPILNEPGISNLRGTIAMAKLGGDPNSATNQWFFNLGDNSANLDNQNGGFTVFGEITDDEGLAVMDALAALPTINAASIQSAFSDLPVRTDGVDPADLSADDLALITRIASIYGLAEEPANQLGDGDTTAEINNPDGLGTVRVITLDGSDPGNIRNFIDVDWKRSGEIKTLTINPGFLNRIGIQITDVAEIDRLIDNRGNSPRGNLDFIVVQDGYANRTELSAPIDGFDLGGVTLPGGFVFPDDIDGDGRSNDNTAIYFGGGNKVATLFRSDADLTGDVVYETASLRKLDVRGDASSLDFAIGDAGRSLDELGAMRVTFRGDVADVGILSQTPISRISADNWTERTPERHIISAPSINAITVKNDLFVDGIVTTDDGVRTVRAGGLIFSSNWSIAGDLNNVRAADAARLNIDVQGDLRAVRLGEVNASSFNVQGDARAFRLGTVTATDLNVAGDARVIQASSWSGDLSVGGETRVFKLSDGGLQGSARFNEAGQGDAPRRILINGPASDGELSWVGEVARLDINGAVTDYTIGGEDESLRNLSIGDATNLDVLLTDEANRIVTGSVLGDSEITLFAVNTLAVNGDFNAVFQTREANILDLDGDVSSEEFLFGAARVVDIRGDLVDTDIQVFLNVFPVSNDEPASDRFRVAGAIENSTISSARTFGDFQAGAILNSTITVGSTDPLTIDAQPGDLTTGIGFDNFTITGLGRNVTSFANSTVVADQIGFLRIANPEPNNNGTPFGFASADIGFLIIETNGSPEDWRPFQAFIPLGGDFQIRLDYQDPAPTDPGA